MQPRIHTHTFMHEFMNAFILTIRCRLRKNKKRCQKNGSVEKLSFRPRIHHVDSLPLRYKTDAMTLYGANIRNAFQVYNYWKRLRLLGQLFSRKNKSYAVWKSMKVDRWASADRLRKVIVRHHGFVNWASLDRTNLLMYELETSIDALS